MGRVIHWVRDSRNHGLIHHTIVTTLALFTSIFLIISIVFSPLFVYGYKEYVRQCERAVSDRRDKNLLKIATEHSAAQFHNGRRKPIETADVHLGWTNGIRNRIIKDLDLSKDEARKLSDRDLLLRACVVFENVFQRYGLRIKC
jgi:hypothetical protein